MPHTIVTLEWFITVYRAKGTLHEHMDVYDRLVEEMKLFADEQGSMQLGAAETQRETERRKEQKRADQLLRGIVPGGVYSELVHSSEAAPRYYPDAAIFFSDFVGFTKIAAALTPRQLIEELSDLFANFDLIMAAPERNKQAAEIGGSQFVARIGVHSGPIIGGIVGRERIRYGIFGDAANTTQRLEAACEPGSVCVSESIHELLSSSPYGSDFTMTAGGTIKPKGKSEMKTWYLRRATPG